MNKPLTTEKPFEYLKKKNGESFSDETVRNWYFARVYVLDKLNDIAFTPDSTQHLQVVVMSDSPLMLAVVRQVALVAHYINFDDTQHDRRTVITLVSHNPEILELLEQEEYLCNLPKYCKHSLYGAEPKNANSFIDIELQIVNEWSGEPQEGVVIMTEEEAIQYRDERFLSIDTRKAVYTSRMYNLGTIINNLPYEDIHNANRYALALEIFQYKELRDHVNRLFDTTNGRNQDLTTVKESLSNIFCADCFESRAKGIALYKKGKCSKKWWEENNEPLSKSEHARWVTEKLIMGYRPLNEKERYKDESVAYDKKKRAQYRKELKSNAADPVHIDICSYADMRRIHPDSMKYDSFLMLAIPKIMERVGGNKNRNCKC